MLDERSFAYVINQTLEKCSMYQGLRKNKCIIFAKVKVENKSKKDLLRFSSMMENKSIDVRGLDFGIYLPDIICSYKSWGASGTAALVCSSPVIAQHAFCEILAAAVSLGMKMDVSEFQIMPSERNVHLKRKSFSLFGKEADYISDKSISDHLITNSGDAMVQVNHKLNQAEKNMEATIEDPSISKETKILLWSEELVKATDTNVFPPYALDTLDRKSKISIRKGLEITKVNGRLYSIVKHLPISKQICVNQLVFDETIQDLPKDNIVRRVRDWNPSLMGLRRSRGGQRYGWKEGIKSNRVLIEQDFDLLTLFDIKMAEAKEESKSFDCCCCAGGC